MSGITAGSPVGPYTVTEVFPQGQGGMARVYKARGQSRSGALFEVALKVMRANTGNPEEERFFSEAINNEVEILRPLRHPNVVRIYPIPLGSRRATPFIARDQNLPGSPWYFVMEYLDGGSLEGVLKRRKRLPVDEAVMIASQIGMALDYIRSKGVAHRDVKPDNILFRADAGTKGRMEPVLVDFGIAAKLRRIGMRAGSVHYMSPERLRVVRGELAPEQVADHAAVDVYGLGALLYQMLTGRRPFEGDNWESITSAILHSTPTLPRRYNPEIPPRLEQVIMQTLLKDPSRRPTAEEIIAWMEQLVPPPWVTPSTALQPPRRESGRLLPWLVSGASTAGLIAVLAYNTFRGSPTPTPTPPVVATTITSPTSLPAATQELLATPMPTPSRSATRAEQTETPKAAAPSRTPKPPTPTPVPKVKPTRTSAPPTGTPSG